MKKIKLFVFSILFFGVTFSQEKDSIEMKKNEKIHAQEKISIKGEVADILGKPIPKALVQVENTSNIVLTDSDGKFEIEMKTPEETLVFSEKNYQTLSKKVYASDDYISVVLEDKHREISEIFITVEKMLQMNKMNIKNIETPLFISTVGADLIQKRNVTSIEDALKSTTGITATSRYGGFMSFNLRGFSDYALLVDGVRDERMSFSWAPMTNINNAERIEVLKGPESVLFGHSVLGGVINIVRKKPSYKQKAEVRFDYGSYNFYGASMGVGGPLSNTLRYRIDASTTKTDGWRDFGVHTNNASLILDYTPTQNDLFQFSIQANNDRYDTESGLPTDLSAIGNVKLLNGIRRDLRYNHPDDIMKHKRWDVKLKYTRKINKNMLITNSTTYSDDDIFYISNDGGLTVNPQQTTITRTSLGFIHKSKPIQNQIDFIYNFEMGNFKNKLIVGNFISYLDRRTHRLGFEGPGATSVLDLYNPIINTGDRSYSMNRIAVRKENVNSYYIQDWLSFSDQFKILLGARFDSFYSNYWLEFYDKTGNKTREQKTGEGTSNTFTYRAGLVYIPVENLSFFGSYSTYFKPTRTFDTQGNVFDPVKGLQGEIGMKFQKGNRFFVNVAGFYIRKHNILEKASADEYKRIGTVDSKGFEIDAEVRPMDNFSIKTGYSYTHARIKDGVNKSQNGFLLEYIPKHLFNAWADYTFTKSFLRGLGVGLGANYVGESFAHSANIYKTAGYFLLDGTLYYKIKNARLGFNLNNILNEAYFSSSIQNFDANPARIMAVPGMGRNFKISLGYQF